MPATKIVKRTGEVVAFDRARIRHAVEKAIRAVGTDIDPLVLDVVVDRVIAEVDDRFVEFFPNVENIQDIVEKHLVREGLYEMIAEGRVLSESAADLARSYVGIAVRAGQAHPDIGSEAAPQRPQRVAGQPFNKSVPPG